MSPKKKKKKKKKHLSSQEKKARAARARKEFAQKLELVAEACGALETYLALPEKFKKEMLDYRINHIALTPEDKVHPGRENLQIIGDILGDDLSDQKIYLRPDSPAISVYDYSTAAWTLWMTLKRNADKIPWDSKAILDQFSVINEWVEKDGGINEIYGKILFSLMLVLSTFDHGLYYYNLSLGNIPGLVDVRFYLNILVKYQPPQITYVNIENKRRPVYRVGWGADDRGISWLSLKPKDLELPANFKNLDLPVYVQSHALKRLEERLDSVSMPSVLHHGVYKSMKKPKVHRMKSGKILIDYKLLGLKLGYLVVDIIEGMVIIRTFLFITHDSTPEGQKLIELLGLNKIDKKYWAIDRLSTFLSEELRTNLELCNLFTQAGCQDLLKDEVFMLGHPKHPHSIRDLIQFIERQHKTVVFKSTSGFFS